MLGGDGLWSKKLLVRTGGLVGGGEEGILILLLLMGGGGGGGIMKELLLLKWHKSQPLRPLNRLDPLAGYARSARWVSTSPRHEARNAR